LSGILNQPSSSHKDFCLNNYLLYSFPSKWTTRDTSLPSGFILLKSIIYQYTLISAYAELEFHKEQARIPMSSLSLQREASSHQDNQQAASYNLGLSVAGDRLRNPPVTSPDSLRTAS
jgi:hypothetical protein